MAVLSTDIKFLKAVVNADGDSNGGRMSATEIQSGVTGNLIPSVSPTERQNGKTRYRKLFIKNNNSNNEIAQNSIAFLKIPTPANDRYRVLLGTGYDTELLAKNYANWLGSGYLAENLAAGPITEVKVNAEITNEGFYAGNTIRVADNTNEDYLTVLSVAWNGTQATLTLNASQSISNSYTADQSTVIVSACIVKGDLKPSESDWSVASMGGTYDHGTYPVGLYNIGTVDDEWTLIFTSATAFSVSGLYSGNVGAGNISTDFNPLNGTSYFFKLEQEGFGGTWQTGDTITFKTISATVPVWAKEIVPAGSVAYTGNGIYIALVFS